MIFGSVQKGSVRRGPVKIELGFPMADTGVVRPLVRHDITRSTNFCVLSTKRTLNRYTKRPLRDSTIFFSTPGMEESAFDFANHRVS